MAMVQDMGERLVRAQKVRTPVPDTAFVLVLKGGKCPFTEGCQNVDSRIQ